MLAGKDDTIELHTNKLQPNWPEYRHQGYTHFEDVRNNHESLSEYFARVFGRVMSTSPNNTIIFIDGQNCCGKTNLAGHNSLKVSMFAHMPYRNIHPLQALDYLIISDSLANYDRNGEGALSGGIGKMVMI